MCTPGVDCPTWMSDVVVVLEKLRCVWWSTLPGIAIVVSGVLHPHSRGSMLGLEP